MVAGKPDLQREVFGFVNSINLNNWTTWHLNLLSTIAYFGIAVNSGDGNLVQSDTGWANFHSSTMSSMVAAAHVHGVRVIVSLDLHDFAYNSTGPMCQGLNPVNTPHTIQQTADLINPPGIDGVNLDYEGTLHYSFTSPTTPLVTNRNCLTQFAHDLPDATPGQYIAIYTLSGSAND